VAIVPRSIAAAVQAEFAPGHCPAFAWEGPPVAEKRTFALTTVPGPGLKHAAVAGDIDIATAGAMQEFLAWQLCATTGSGGLVVDLSAVTFMDARGLTALLRARHLAADLAIPFRIAAPAACVARLLRVTGLHRHFAMAHEHASLHHDEVKL
jgi:anti-sigma B factor antagonist